MYVICQPITGGYSKVIFEVLIWDIKWAFHPLIIVAEQRLENPKGTIRIDLNFYTVGRLSWIQSVTLTEAAGSCALTFWSMRDMFA